METAFLVLAVFGFIVAVLSLIVNYRILLLALKQ